MNLAFAQSKKYVGKGARISTCGTYRYTLVREWRGTHNRRHWRWFGEKDGAGHELGEPLSALFVMLNPSTADAMLDDPTICKCVGFAKLWRFEMLEVVNLFAYRTASPRDLLAAQSEGVDVIGWENQKYVQEAARDAGLIICAWGAHAAEQPYHVEEVRGWLGNKRQFCFGLTKNGHPRHPLYVPYNQKLIPMPE